jgi:hypothetical protein
MTLKSSIAVVCQLAALKGSAEAQFRLFGLTALFRPSILTHFVQNRPREISKVAHLMEYDFGYIFIILDEGCLRKSNYIFAVFKVLILCDRETTEAVAQNLEARQQ